MKIRILSLVITLISILGAALAQEKEYPVATPTDQPNVVISPYNSSRQLDVAGLEPGSLAEDPIAKKIFRIPFSNPTKRYYQDHGSSKTPAGNEIPPPPITSGSSTEIVPPPPINNTPKPPRKQPKPNPEPSGPNSPSWVPVSQEMPTDLLNFIYAFNQNSSVNDINALLPFYADPMDDYFGKKNVSRAAIRADRAAYIERFPQRKYVLESPPVLLGQNGDIYEVMTRVRYAVGGNGRDRSGAVSDYFKIQRGPRYFQIISINEARASAAPASIQEQDSQRINTQSPINTSSSKGSIYSRFEVDQITLFLDAFAASGEVNEPSAMLEFLHPRISSYYGQKNPSSQALVRDRQNYIKRWPNRRYWLTEKPLIKPLASGTWDIISKTGYEVRSSSREVKKGVATSAIRLVNTSTGLKISSIRTLK